MCLHRYTTDIRPCYGENTPFPWCERVGGARPAQGIAPGRRQGTTGTEVRQVWKNNGSAVETEPHGETSTIGDEKRRNINGLDRAALERKEQVREYRVRSQGIGQFCGRPYRKAAVAARARVWLQRFPREPGDSLGNRGGSRENFSVLRRVTRCVAVLQTTYKALTIDFTAAGLGHVAAGCLTAKRTRTATGMHGDVGAGLDIRVDAHVERGDGDAHSRGVVSVAATVARRCTGREPMLTASIAAVAVTVEPVSGGAARGNGAHSTVAVGSGARCAGHSRNRQ